MTGTKLAISNSSGGCVPRVPRGNDTNESIVGVKLRYAHRLFGQLQRPLFCRWLKALGFFLLLFFSLCASVDPTSDERVNARTHSSPLHLLIYSKRLTFRSQSAFSSLKSLLFFSQELDFFFFISLQHNKREIKCCACCLRLIWVRILTVRPAVPSAAPWLCAEEPDSASLSWLQTEDLCILKTHCDITANSDNKFTSSFGFL